MDYNLNKLIVRVPIIGHEIMVNLFDIMKGSGTGYPEHYGKSSIVIIHEHADRTLAYPYGALIPTPPNLVVTKVPFFGFLYDTFRKRVGFR
jgi:hypothetical protein